MGELCFMRFHPDFKLARFLPRAIFTPGSLGLVRWGFKQLAKWKKGLWKRIDLPSGQYVLQISPKPPSQPGPVVMWIHGGGLIMGTPEQETELCIEIAKRSDVTVVIPSYRLAPEQPFPAALDDLSEAFEWITKQPWADCSRLTVGGNSAGGGLAAGFVLNTLKADIRPGALILHQPMLDVETCARPDPDLKSLRIWSAASNRFAWNAYLKNVSGPVPATASPALANNAQLSGFPPTWLSVGTADLFHDETNRFSERLSASGVPNHFYPIDGAFHGFESFAPKAAVSRKFATDLTRWIRNTSHTKT